jgi:hypothetical protein
VVLLCWWFTCAVQLTFKGAADSHLPGRECCLLKDHLAVKLKWQLNLPCLQLGAGPLVLLVVGFLPPPAAAAVRSTSQAAICVTHDPSRF